MPGMQPSRVVSRKGSALTRSVRPHVANAPSKQLFAKVGGSDLDDQVRQAGAGDGIDNMLFKIFQ